MKQRRKKGRKEGHKEGGTELRKEGQKEGNLKTPVMDMFSVVTNYLPLSLNEGESFPRRSLFVLALMLTRQVRRQDPLTDFSALCP